MLSILVVSEDRGLEKPTLVSQHARPNALLKPLSNIAQLELQAAANKSSVPQASLITAQC